MGRLFDLTLTLRIRSSALVLAPLQALLRLHGVDDVRDDSAAYRHRNPLVLSSDIFLNVALALPGAGIVMVTANHTDLAAQISRLRIEVGLVERVA